MNDALNLLLHTLTRHSNGTVLLECFQCVETLVFVSKHAEGEGTEKVGRGAILIRFSNIKTNN